MTLKMRQSNRTLSERCRKISGIRWDVKVYIRGSTDGVLNFII